MYQVTQGARSNLIGDASSLERVKELVLADLARRYAGSPTLTVSHDKSLVVASYSGGIAVHYRLY